MSESKTSETIQCKRRQVSNQKGHHFRREGSRIITTSSLSVDIVSTKGPAKWLNLKIRPRPLSPAACPQTMQIGEHQCPIEHDRRFVALFASPVGKCYPLALSNPKR